MSIVSGLEERSELFSGIIEGAALITECRVFQNTLKIIIEKPTHFDDIKTGDSISTSGVCLTVEEISEKSLTFTLGQETLNVTGWNSEALQGQLMNLERSLRLGDRIHGHLVSGHVDTTAKVVSLEKGESWVMRVEVPAMDRRYVWAKGSITLNGVSLTVNKIFENTIEVCLIPETIMRTNLKNCFVGQVVNVEYDYWAKAFVNYQEQKEGHQ